MSQDYHYQKVTGKHAATGYPVDEHHHLLDYQDRRGGVAKELTSPYGALTFVVGSGDDFWCFDYAVLNPERGDGTEYVVLHATINSESGSFIMDAPDGYRIVPINDAIREAQGLIDQAVEWTYDNDVRHTRKGWNQDPRYFVRAVCLAVLTRGRDGLKTNPYSDRQMRLGGRRVNALLDSCLSKLP